MSSTDGERDYWAKHDMASVFNSLETVLKSVQPTHPLRTSVKLLSLLEASRNGQIDERVSDYAVFFRENLPVEDTDEPSSPFSGFTWDNRTDEDDQKQQSEAALVQNALNEAATNVGPTDAEKELCSRAVSGGGGGGAGSRMMPQGRRFSISAESYTPNATQPFQRVVIAKTAEVRLRIEHAVKDNLLFRNLDVDQRAAVIDAMFEKKVMVDEEVIRQGDEGDYFYVIESGQFEVVKDGEHVVYLGPGETFGELALMYGSPRMATVRAVSSSLLKGSSVSSAITLKDEHVLWAVDRTTFRCLVIDASFAKRRRYEAFLRSVPLLATLFDSEIFRICDALQPVSFEANSVIVKQGDVGSEFFVIEEGQAQVFVDDPNSANRTSGGNGDQSVAHRPMLLVSTITKGDYFGELALLRDAPRAATVRAVTPVKCLSLSKADFIRLLGPVMPILQRNQEHYRKYEEYLY